MKPSPWNAHQTLALWESAEHWLKNWAKPESARIYVDSCPCCKEFLDEAKDEDAQCDGCPIKEYTGLALCKGTPWGACAAAVESRTHIFLRRRNFKAEYRFIVELAIGERRPPNIIQQNSEPPRASLHALL